MTSYDSNHANAAHRRAMTRPAMLGALIGLLVVLGGVGYIVFEVVMTPATPTVRTAPAREIVDFISDARGLQKLPRYEQEKFLTAWKADLTATPGRREELKKCFEGLSENQRHVFSDSIFDHLKRSFMDDAKAYQRLPENDRFKFVRERYDMYTSDAMFLKDVAMAFKSDFRWSPDEQQTWIMEHTSAEERAIGEPYVNALQRVKIQAKKEEELKKAPPTQPASEKS